MAVRCAKCGEELLGAVNRCWRCGHKFPQRNGPAGVPPVRRAPVAVAVPAADDPTLPVMAGLADTPAEDLAVSVSTAIGNPSDVRRGSPFASGVPLIAVAAPRRLAVDNPSEDNELADSPSKTRRNTVATASAFVGLALGVVGMALYRFPPVTFALAAMGLGLALFSFAGQQRRATVLAILLTSLALTLGVYGSALLLYERAYGRSFWQDRSLPSPEDEGL